MAEFVNQSITRMLALAAFGTALSLAWAAPAENLPDPTRPPIVAAAATATSAASGPVLQSVLVASGRKIAVIDGQTVQIGDKVGEARVVKIAEAEVVLSKGKEVQTLKLFPGIEKRRASVGAPVKPESRR